ncbi:MAG: hypothetical protein NXI30_10360 [bacterium]|nr:hypothetical protein [bacterium]
MSLFAATVDAEEDAAAVAADLGFPVAHGVTREIGDAIGAWWEEKRDFIQPSEFLLTQSGRVMSSTYSSSPVGRMDPEETLFLATMLAQRAKKS